MKRLPDIEWDFSTVPDDQVWVCHAWEFGRTKILTDNPCFQHNPDDWRDGDMFSWSAPTWHFASPWPHVSFMSLERDRREDMGGRLQRNKGLDPCPIQTIRESDEPISSCDNAILLPAVGNSEMYVAAFQFDWRFSNKAIVSAFAAWVEENRPEYIKTLELRGRQAPLAMDKENLEALGILRIIEHHQIPIGKIIPFYEEVLASRFSGEPAWSKAKKRAMDVLASFR